MSQFIWNSSVWLHDQIMVRWLINCTDLVRRGRKALKPLGLCNPAYYGIQSFNTLKPKQDGRHFTDDIFKCIFFKENVWIPIKFHWILFSRVQVTYSSTGWDNGLAPSRWQAIIWPMMASLPTHIGLNELINPSSSTGLLDISWMKHEDYW